MFPGAKLVFTTAAAAGGWEMAEAEDVEMSASAPAGAPAAAINAPVVDLTLPFPPASYEVLWIVGLDGSQLSYRCLRLVAMTMKLSGGKHKLLALNMAKSGDPENSKIFNEAETQARAAGVNMFKSFSTKSLKIPRSLCATAAADGWSLVDTLVYFANHTARFRGRLVLGAKGLTGADQPKMDRLGHVALSCLDRVKVPVTIVKEAWRGASGDHNAMGRIMRVGRNGLPGLTIVRGPQPRPL
eukprot:3137343-Prymnesium_polylepis.1